LLEVGTFHALLMSSGQNAQVKHGDLEDTEVWFLCVLKDSALGR
jgi:hypothetical protein